MTGLGFLDGNWEELKDKSSKVTLIEPVVEAVMQLFFQFLIVLIIFGPNLDKGDHIYIINYYIWHNPIPFCSLKKNNLEANIKQI